MIIKSAAIGSISSATLRTQDLISAFADELEWQLRRNGEFFSMPENFALRDKFNGIVGEAQDCWSEDGNEIADDKEETADWLVNESLTDTLEYFAPAYCYFGAHCGDGADFGYWPCTESIDELPTVEDGETASLDGEDCKTVTDHGNVTVWSGGKAVLELV